MAERKLSSRIVTVLMVLGKVLSEVTVSHLVENEERQLTKLNMVHLLQNIHQQRYIETLVLYRMWNTDNVLRCPFVELLNSFNLPIIISSSESTYSYKTVFSNEAVVLVCESHPNRKKLLENSKILQDLLQSRFIIYFEHGSTRNAKQQLENCCEEYFSLEIYNILVVFSDFGSTNSYYNCRKHSADGTPYRTKLLNKALEKMYENQFLNMYGGAISTFSDQVQPRTILVCDSDGTLHMDGYVGKLITTFAAIRNATLQYKYPIELGVKISEDDMLLILRNGSIDIASMLADNTALESFEDVTYPYEFVNYCLMIPLPNVIPKNKIFTSIIEIHVLAIIFILFIAFAALLTYSLNKSYKQMSFLNVFLNDMSMRGLLGQPFTKITGPSFNTQFICFLLCYTSLVINAMYQAYLQASLTTPPTEPMIRSFDDIAAANLKVFMWTGELHFLNTLRKRESDPHYFYIFEHIIEATENYTEFIMQRASLSTRYIYPTTDTRWNIFLEQQKLFGRPLFYYSDDICLLDYTILGVAVRRSLPYRDLLEDHILRIRESGLFDYWFLFNIYDMEETNLTNLKTHRNIQRYGGPIVLMDFYWIWWMYFLNIVVCLLGFVWEFGTWKFKLRAKN